MVDLPKIPKRNELLPQVSSSVGAGDYAAVGKAWQQAANSVAQGAVEFGTPLAQEEGRKAVVRDENGNLKVEMPPIIGPLGDVARKSAEATFAIQAQAEVEKGLRELRNKTWLPVEQGGGGGDPRWFDRVSSEFITQFAGRHRGGFQGIVQQLGLRVASQHQQGLVNEKERIDLKNQNDVLKGREAELQSRLATLAFDNGTDSDEFRQTVTELQAIRGQRSADPRFGYSPEEVRMDAESDARTMRGMAVVGQARRDYQATGDLEGAKSRAEEALQRAGVPIDERMKMLGQVNSQLSGMAAVKQQQKQELRDQALEIDNRLKLGEKVPDNEIGQLIGGMVRVGMHNEARRLAVQQATQFGAGLITPGMTAEQRVEALNRAKTFQGLTVEVPPDRAGGNAPVPPAAPRRPVSTTPVPPPNPDPNLPAGMRNNNPGNIKFIPQLGERYGGVVGPSQNTDQGDPQAVFATPEDGMRAMVSLAMRKYDGGKTTANELIAGQGGWTPGNTGAAENIARSMGLGPNDDLNLKDPEQRFKFARALMRQEHGEASSRYSDDMVRAAVSGGQRPEIQSQAQATPQAQPAVAASGNTLSVARVYLGMTEDDPKHAATLAGFMKKAGGHNIDPASTAWCAGFADAVLAAGGFQRRGSLRAADFLNYGTATTAPNQGDVVVFKPQARGSSGHVGFVVGIEGDRVRYIAGNDGGAVQEATLPMSEVAGFRVPPRAGTPIPGVTDATAPGLTQQRAATVAFGSSYVGGVAYQAAQRQNDAIVKMQLDQFEKSFSLPGGGPNAEQIDELLKSVPTVADPEIRQRALDALTKNEARLATLTDPRGVREAMGALEVQAAEGKMPFLQRQFLQSLQKSIETQDKELATKPYLAGSRMEWDGDAAPRTMKAAAAPINFGDPSAVRTQIESRSTASQLLEARMGRPASSLLDSDDAEALRGAAPGMDAAAVRNIFQSLAGARKEPLQATLSDKAAREALVALTKTTDPAKFNAAMQGLDMIMRRDQATFIDKMDADTQRNVLKWRDMLSMASDPKEIQRLMNPTAKGKEGEIEKQLRDQGKREAFGLEEKDILREYTSMAGRIFGGNPDAFLKPAPGQDQGMPSAMNAFRADLANEMGEFMASGMTKEEAKTAAFKQVMKSWRVSSVTGQIMKHAPDDIYTREFGMNADAMKAEVRDAIFEASGQKQAAMAELMKGRTPSEAERQAIAGQLKAPDVKFSLVPTRDTQEDMSAWKRWEDGGKQGPRPRPPGYAVMFVDQTKNPPQLRMVEDERGQPMTFRWDTARVQKMQADKWTERERLRDALKQDRKDFKPLTLVP